MSNRRAVVRSSVALDDGYVRCVVMDSLGILRARLGAYQLTAARTIPAYQLNGPETLHAQIARATLDLLKGHCCYGLFSKRTACVKLGMTNNVFRRWSALEAEHGILQLVAVWQTDADNRRDLERQLHEHFAAHARGGEWFDAAPVLAELRDALAATPLLPGAPGQAR